jgi:hypothetical protein
MANNAIASVFGNHAIRAAAGVVVIVLSNDE